MRQSTVTCYPSRGLPKLDPEVEVEVEVEFTPALEVDIVSSAHLRRVPVVPAAVPAVRAAVALAPAAPAYPSIRPSDLGNAVARIYPQT